MTTSPLDDLFSSADSAGGDFLVEDDLGGLPALDLTFEVSKAEATTSTSGDPMLKINLKVAEGPLKGKMLIARYTYKATGSEGGKGIVWRSLEALGITREFAKQVTQGLPAQSQVTQLFIETAKRVAGVRVKANVSAQGGAGQYADRVQVNYALKSAGAQISAPAAPAVQAPPQVETPVSIDEPSVPGLSIGGDNPAF